MNDKNLIPFTERTEKEQREIARKGGVASGKSRRKRKAMRDTLEIILSQPVSENNSRILMEFGIADGDNSSLLLVKMFQQALKGDIRAFDRIVQLLDEGGEKEARIALIKAQTDHINGVEAEVEDLSDIESRIYGE